MTIATVAVTPILGGPTVIASTMKALSAPPVPQPDGLSRRLAHPAHALTDDEQRHPRHHDRHDGRERQCLEDPDALAELPHHRGLHRAGEPGGESQHDREGVPAGHGPHSKLAP
jgi:hypothetical protein